MIKNKIVPYFFLLVGVIGSIYSFPLEGYLRHCVQFVFMTVGFLSLRFRTLGLREQLRVRHRRLIPISNNKMRSQVKLMEFFAGITAFTAIVCLGEYLAGVRPSTMVAVNVWAMLELMLMVSFLTQFLWEFCKQVVIF